MMGIIKPKALKLGDTVSLISPASPPDPSELKKGIERFEKMGFKVKMNLRPATTSEYLSARDEERAEEIAKAFEDPETKAIFCTRGGYGIMRLLPLIDWAKISRNPKVFVGYSDLTPLLINLYQRASLVSFHGPMISKDFSMGLTERAREFLLKSICTEEPLGGISLEGMEIIKNGRSRGILMGGCLSLICHTMGTPYGLSSRGKLLFLEDTGEAPYRIDRMLTHLKLSGMLEDVSGIIFGLMTQCNPPAAEGCSVKDVIEDVVKDLKKPVVYGFPSGHCKENLTLPFGVTATLDTDRGKLIIEEAAVR